MAVASTIMPPLVLNDREDLFCAVEVLYHGESADPKLTLRVTQKKEGWTVEVSIPEDKALEAFQHPFAYIEEREVQ